GGPDRAVALVVHWGGARPLVGVRTATRNGRLGGWLGVAGKDDDQGPDQADDRQRGQADAHQQDGRHAALLLGRCRVVQLVAIVVVAASARLLGRRRGRLAVGLLGGDGLFLLAVGLGLVAVARLRAGVLDHEAVLALGAVDLAA